MIFHIFLFKVTLVMYNTTTTSSSTPAITGKVLLLINLTFDMITKQLSMFFLSNSIVSTVQPQMCACATFFSKKNILSVFIGLTYFN